MDITEADVAAANRRGKAQQSNYPITQSARYDRQANKIILAMNSGVELMFSPSLAEGLQQAHPNELEVIEVTPSGLGIHFPLIDADLYVPALLKGLLGTQQWMAAEMGRAGGRVTSPTKTASARQNGKLGGRPRKVA